MKIETSKLSAALDHIRPIIGRRMTLPILSCVRLSCGSGVLKIEATDLDQYQCEQIDCADPITACCVSYSSLCMALAGESVEIEQQLGRIIVKSSLGSAELETLDNKEWPSEMKCVQPKKHGVNCADIAAAIKGVQWSASVEVARYVLQSVHVIGTAKKITVEATDGRTLAIMESAAISSEFEMLPPSELCGNLCSALCRSGSVLTICENHIRVDYDSGYYVAKQVEGKFPNTGHLLTEKTEVLGTAPVELLKEIFSKLHFYLDPKKTAWANCEFLPKGISIKMPGRDCTMDFIVPGKFKAHTAKIGVVSFLNCIKNCHSDEVKIMRGTGMRKIVLDAGNLQIHSMEWIDSAISSK